MVNAILKRSFDIFLSLTGLALSAPLWLVIALAVKLEDGGPVFYEQDRVGKDNRIFRIKKFRSMVKDAEKRSGGAWRAIEDDLRVTKVGRVMRSTAMDELPQLLSILKGDMSFVGPRPEPAEWVDKLTKDLPEFKLRHVVTPGLTGVAQVLGSAYTDYPMKLKYDMWYVKNHTFLFDLYIILLSFLVTFMGRWEIKEDKFGFLIKPLKEALGIQ